MYKPAGQVERGDSLLVGPGHNGPCFPMEVTHVKRYRLPQDPHKVLHCIITLADGRERRCGENFMLQVAS